MVQNFTPRYIPNINKNICAQINVFTDIHNSQKKKNGDNLNTH